MLGISQIYWISSLIDYIIKNCFNMLEVPRYFPILSEKKRDAVDKIDNKHTIRFVWQKEVMTGKTFKKETMW